MLEGTSGSDALSNINSLVSIDEVVETPPVEAPKQETPISDEGKSDETLSQEPQKGEESPEKGQEVTPEPEKGLETPLQALFKAKIGEAEQDLSGDLVFTIKVDKKDEQIALKDLIRQYQGRIPIEKHLGQLKKDRNDFETEKKSFSEQKNLVEGHMREIVDLLKSNPKKALEKIVLMSGGNPGEFEAIYADEMTEMDERERKLFLREKALEHKEATEKRRREMETFQAQENERAQIISQTVDEGIKRFGLEQNDVGESWQQFLSQQKEGKVNLWKMHPVEIGQKVIANVIENVRPKRIFNELNREIGLKVTPTDDDFAFFKKVFHPDLDGNDIVDVMRRYYNLDNGSKSVEVQPETSESSKGGATKPTPPKTPQKAKVEEADEDEDDVDPKSYDALIRSAQKKKIRR